MLFAVAAESNMQTGGTRGIYPDNTEDSDSSDPGRVETRGRQICRNNSSPSRFSKSVF